MIKSLPYLLLPLVFSVAQAMPVVPMHSFVDRDAPLTLQHLEGLHHQAREQSAKKSSVIRENGLRDVATSLGARSALAWRTKQINTMLEQQSKSLGQVFNFSAMVLDHHVLPPVLLRSDANLNLADAQTIRLSDRTYQIIQQARFVTRPPSWRDYLIRHYKTPKPPHPSMLPRDLAERKIWKKAVKEGWNQGITQAEGIFRVSVAKMKRDFEGMVLFKTLLAQHMVSAPFVATTHLGITGDKNKIAVNDKVLRITALPALQADSHVWKARVTHDE